MWQDFGHADDGDGRKFEGEEPWIAEASKQDHVDRLLAAREAVKGGVRCNHGRGTRADVARAEAARHRHELGVRARVFAARPPGQGRSRARSCWV
jgi:hypothetical protein